MRTRRLFGWATIAVLGVLAFAAPASAYNIWAGITLDVHQDIPDGSLPDGRLPNDFHIEGLICTASGVAPVLSNHLDGLFPIFNYSITKLNPGDPADCWYTFVADWELNAGDLGIPYCTVVHLGLLFSVEDENTMIDLVGWWTLDGVRVGDVIGGYPNEGYVPALGFYVDPVTATPGPSVRIGNGFIPPFDPPAPPLPPPGPVPIDVEVTELDVVVMNRADVPLAWFEELYDGGAQDSWGWVPVLDGAGNDIDPTNPFPLAADSFFDVFLEGTPGMGDVTPATPVDLPGHELLFVRSKRNFINNNGVTYPGGGDTDNGLWQWHIHEAQGIEACCFVDGSCQDLTPIDCAAQGGFPQGAGSDCATTVCPVEDQACCYADGSCRDEDPNQCLANGGTPQGVGTVCATTDCPLPDPEACCLPDGTCVVLLPADCLAQNGTPMGVPNCDGVVCEEGEDYAFEFSLDIGSDIELSDPLFDGDEAADPGDVYWWQSAVIAPPGRDGFKDDILIFALDPWPDPPDGAVPPATRVPVGTGSPDDYHTYFDLDGHDQIDVSLRTEYELVGLPLAAPIPQWASSCIYSPEFLAVSFDDDQAPGWPANDVPVMVPSPAGVSSYGTTAGQDEVIGVTLGSVIPPAPIVNRYAIADEVTVHQSMIPNPDASEADDDDVDSLDIVRNQLTCPYWYFSPDHEADYGLDPGDIYEVSAGGVPWLVIDDVNNLGLLPDTDVDAFEFAWLTHETQGLVFGVLFSVDEDDPLTPVDESGGLSPRIIYGSFLTGSYFVFAGPLEDDIDALTIWFETLEKEKPEACCYPDGSCVDETAASCTANGGTPQGSGTDCSTTTCPQPTEACCYPDGSCVDETAASCTANGGTPQGSGTDCSTTTCPEPTEACCYPDGSCVDETAASCTGNGGTPQGSGTDCSTTTCPEPTEACCYPDGSCVDETAASCTGNGGTPQGSGTDCSTTTCPEPTEACCYPDGSCVDETAASCTANGGTPQGSGTDCSTTTCPQPTEACCYHDGSCVDETAASCTGNGGTPQGSGTDCATTTCPEPTEACCYPDGSCVDETAASCTGNGGTPQGSGTDCATTTCPEPTEACCYPDGSCVDETAASCTGNGGTPQGSGTDCATTTCPEPTEACCYPDGSCVDETAASCTGNGGTPQGSGTDCSTTTCPEPTEACCYPDGSCVDETAASCTGNGGTPQGSGTDCATTTCPEQPVYKWEQPPDLDTTGIDVSATYSFILADDFECTMRGPLTEIQVWGSWYNDLMPFGGTPGDGDPAAIRFTLSIHEDIPDPDGSGPEYSMPASPPVWMRTFSEGEFMVELFAGGILEGWMNPPDVYTFPGDTMCWRYTFLIPREEAFFQEGTTASPIVYWLDVQAEPLDATTYFGWKTTLGQWNDNAVWGVGVDSRLTWEEMYFPPGHTLAGAPLDLAFALIGEPELIRGDFEPDGDVDQDDYDAFIDCFTGPGGGPLPPECLPGDFDDDDDIDCDDWEMFKMVWTGPPVDPPAFDPPAEIPGATCDDGLDNDCDGLNRLRRSGLCPGHHLSR